MRLKALFMMIVCSLCLGCNSSTIDDLQEITEDVPRRSIDTSRLGVNAFVNDGRFGSIGTQFSEVKNVLRLNFVRVLFNWDDNVQPSPNANPNFSFYDDIINGLAPGLDALIVVTGVPSWMADSSDWVNGNPRTTFVDRWVAKVAERYGSHPQVIGLEVWNEPNMTSNSQNVLMGLAASAENCVELLTLANNTIRTFAPSKLIIGSATTAINQNFSETLDYNRSLQAAGAENFVDVWGVHYYGKQYENLVRDDGVADFLNSLSKPVWVTESGAQGVNSQLAYGEEVWPYLIEKVPGIARIYVYQFTEATPADVTYGLRNLTEGLLVSDLYVHLRDRG